MIRRLVLASLLALHALGPAGAGPRADQEQAPVPLLRHNPFERATLPESSSREGRSSVVEAPVSWTGSLRGTVVAATRSMANVDGEILLVGEALDGYVLVEVREGEAVFVRDGKRRVLTLE